MMSSYSHGFLKYFHRLWPCLLLPAFTLSAQGPLQISLSFSAPSCAGDTDGSATVTAQGGVPPYTYSWNNGQQTPTLQNIGAGTYTVTVTDNAGTSRIGAVQVTEPAPIFFNVVTNIPSCNGFPATMTVLPYGGTPPYLIQWSNGTQGATSAGLLPMTTYTVTVTDAKGCVRDTLICPPTIDSLKVQLLIKKADCVGINNGVATALVTPSGGNYRFTWNVSPLNAPQIGGLAPGTFVAVTVTDQTTGCSGTAGGVVGTHTQIKIKVSGTTLLNCANDKTGTATAQASNGTPPYTYVWQGPGVQNVSSSTLTGLGPGFYAVTATDARGCTAVGGLNIGVRSDLKADFTFDKFCSDTTFWVKFLNASTSSVSIVAWEWRIVWNGGSFGSNQPDIAVPIPNRNSGFATLIVTSSEGCTDTIVKPFSVDSLLDFKIVTPGYSCDGSAVLITVIGDSTFNYTWTPTDFLVFSPGPQRVLADPPATTKYQLRVSNGSCIDTDTVLVLRQPLLELTAKGDEICGDLGTLSASTNVPALIIWTTLSGDTINPLAAPPGIYRVIATDSFACVRTDTAEVVRRTPQVKASVPAVACPSEPFVLAAQNLNPVDDVKYLWTVTPPTLVIAEPDAAVTTAVGPLGTYIVQLIVASDLGCSDTLTFTVSIQDSIDLEPFLSIRQGCNRFEAFFINSSGLPGAWNFGDGNLGNSSGQDTLVHTYGAPGTYTVSFMPAVSCAKTHTLIFNPSDSTFTVTAPDVTACKPAAALSASANRPATFTWFTLGGQPVANPAAVGSGTYVVQATDASGTCFAYDTATVTLVDSLDLTPFVGTTQPCNAPQIQYANASPFSGTWTFGDGNTSTLASGTHTYAAFGTYTVTFTPNADCALPVAITVELTPDNFTVSAPDVTACKPAAALSASANRPATFNWFTLGGQPVANPNAVIGGTYVVQAVDASGTCFAYDTATVTLVDSLDLTPFVGATQPCNAPQIQYANASPFSGTWTFGDGNSSTLDSGTHTYADFGSYTVTFTPNANCALPVAITVKLTPDNFTVSATDVTACKPAAALSASANRPATFTWFTLGGQPVANPNAVTSGTYVVQAVDASGLCVVYDTATVTLVDSLDLTPFVGTTQPCNEAQIQYANASPFSGTWTFGDGNSSTLASGTHTYADFGSYTVTFTPNADCALPVAITVELTPDNFAVSATDVTACKPAAALSASANRPATFNWFTAGGQPVANPNAVTSGTYVVQAVDTSGLCVVYDTATVVLVDSLDLTPFVGATQPCNEAQIQYANASPFSGTWTFGDGNSSALASGTHTYADFGSYTVTFTPNADCALPVAITVKLTPDNFTVSATDVTACKPAAALSASANRPATFTWFTLGGQPVANPSAVGSGTYVVQAVDASGLCVVYDTATVTLVDSLDLTPFVGATQPCNAPQIQYANASPFSGTWTFGDGNTSTLASGTHTYAAFGTYTVTFTPNADCALPVAITVELTPDNFAVSAPDVTACKPAAALSASANRPATFNWFTLGGQPVANPNAVTGGTYVVQATDASGLCVAYDTATVTLVDSLDLTPFVGTTQPCNAPQIQYANASPFSGTWTFGDGNSSTLASGTHTYADFGSYTVTFTPNADCALPVAITVEVKPDNFAVSAPDVTACKPAAALSASANRPATFTWFTLGGQPVANPNAVTGGTYVVQATDASGLCVAYDTATVTLVDSLDFTPFVGATQPCNEAQIQYANASPFSGTWTFGDGNSSTLDSGTHTYADFGSYTVTFTPNADCALPVAITVELTPDNFAVSATDVTACKPAAALSASANRPATFNWFTAGGQPVANPNAVTSGTYVVQATDASGLCVAYDTATVTLVDSLDLTPFVSAAQPCNEAQIQYANASPFSGTWTFGDGNSSTLDSGTHTYADFGSYTVTFTPNADCALPVAITVKLTPDNFTVSATDVTACKPAAALSASANRPATFNWFTLGGQPVANPNAVTGGTYVVQAVDASGTCFAYDTATVTLVDSLDFTPFVGATQPCNEAQIQYANASPFSGTWTFGDGNSSTLDSGTHTYADFGSYTVTFTPNADCALPVAITVELTPDNFAVSAPDVTACKPAAALSASANRPATFNWFTLGGQPVANPSAVGSGTYVVQAVDASGTCFAYDTATVTLVDSLDLTPFVGTTQPCNEAQIQYANASPFSGTWTFGDGNSSALASGTHTYADFGSYTVTFTPNADCALPVAITVELTPDNFAVSAPDVTACKPAAALSASANRPATFNWFTLGGQPVANPNAVTSGTYVVQATDASGLCVAYDTATVTLVDSLDLTPFVGATQPCNEAQIQYANASSFSGTWTFGDGNSSTLASGTHTYADFGSYTVTFTPNADCALPVAITVELTPDNFAVSATDVTACKPAAALSASANRPATFTWFTLGGQPVANPNAVTGGTYVVQAVDTSGLCVVYDTATVVLVDSLDLTPFIGATQPCNAPQIQYANASPFSGTWTFGDGNTSTLDSGTHTYADFGSYTVTFTPNADCALPVAITVELTPDNFAVSAPDVTACKPAAALSASANRPATFTWFTLGGQPVANPSAVGSGTYVVQATDASGLCVAYDTATVTLVDSLDLTPFVSATQPCNEAQIQYANASPFSGTWTFGDGNSSTLASGTHTYADFGSYTVTFTPNADCALPVAITVELTPDNFTVSATDVTACKPAAALSASANRPATFNWFTLGGQPVANPNAVTGGIYVVQAVDTSGLCVVYDTATVVLVDSLDLTPFVGATQPCNEAQIQYANASPFSGTWTFGDGNTSTLASGTHTYADFGSYTVTFTPNADCALPVAITVELTPDNFAVSATDVTACKPAAALSASANRPATFNWFTLDGQPVANPSAVGSGTYVVQAVDASGTCFAYDTATVTLVDSLDLTPFVGATQPCNAPQIQYANASPFSGTWTFGDGNSSTLASGTHTYADFGSYTVTFTPNADCALPVAITVELTPDNFAVSAPDVTACKPAAALSASANRPATFNWFTLGGQPVANPSAVGSGTYVVQAVDASGTCFAYDTATVTLVDSLDLTPFVGATQPCNAPQIQYTNASPFSGTWTFGDGNSSTLASGTHTYADFGSYTVTFTPNADCALPVAITVELTPDNFAVSAPDVTACKPAAALSASANRPATFTWFTLGGQPVANPNAVTGGTYVVQAVDASGLCVVYDTATVTLVDSLDLTPFVGAAQPCNAPQIQYTNASPFSGTWTFGDGNTSTLASGTHTYADFGSYTVTFTPNADCALPVAITVELTPDNFAVSAPDVTACKPAAALSASANRPATFTWFTLGGQPVANPNAVTGGTYVVQAVDTSGLCVVYDTATVVLVDSLDLTPFVGAAQPCNEAQIQYANASPFSGTWTFGDGNSSTLASGTHTYADFGSYTVTFTPNADCALPVAITVELTPDNFAVSAPDVTACKPAAALSASANRPATFNWFTLGGQPVANPNAVTGGTYVVQATDASGLCVAYDTATVTLVDSLDFTPFVGATQPCNEAQIQYANASPFSGTWTFGDGNSSALASGTHTYADFGSYTVTFTPNADCALPVAITVELTPDNFAVSATDVTACKPAAALSASANRPATFNWFTAGGQPVANPNAVTSGTYVVQATDASGLCVAYDTATVTLVDSLDLTPFVSATQPCNEAQIQYTNASPFSGTWTFGDGNSSTLASGTHTYADFGSYTVTFTPNADCALPVAITVELTPDNFAVSATDVTACKPAAALSASANRPATFNWFTLGGQPVANPNAVTGGTYVVQAVDTSGLCVVYDTATVVLVDSLDLTAFVGATQPCNEAQIQYANASPFSGTWTFGDGNTSTLASGTHTYADFGSYTVTFTPNADCALPVAITVELTPDNFAVSATDVTACKPAAALSASANRPATFNWFTAGGQPVANPNAVTGGTYVVQAVDTSGLCVVYDTATVVLVDSLDLTPFVGATQPCNEAQIQYANASPFSGTWTFGDGNSSTLASGTHTYADFGSYTVTFTPNADCALPVAITVKLTPDNFAVSATDVTACKPAAALSASANRPATFNWFTAGGQPVANPNAVTGGTYVVQAVDTSGLCVVYDTATVVLVDSLDLTPFVGATQPCNEAQIQYANASPFSGTWTFGDGNSSTLASGTHTYADFGSYTVTFTPNADCALPVAITVQLTPDNFTVSATDVTACKPAAALSASANRPATFNWFTAGGQPVANPNAVTGGTYVVQAVDTSGLCVVYDTATVVLLDSIDISAKISVSPQCNSLVVVFQNTSGYAGVWDFGDGTKSTSDIVEHLYTSPGLYTVQFIGSEPCVKPFAMVVEVRFDSFAVAAPDVTVCGYSAELQATTSLPATLVWYDLQGNVVDAGGVEEGTYVVVATDLTGRCTATDTVHVRTIFVEVSAEVIGKDTLCRNDTTTLSATVKGNASTYTYSWTPAETLIGANTPNPLAVPNGPQVYTVAVVADGLCVDTASVEVYFIEYVCRDPYVFVPKAFTPNGDGNNDYFRVRGADITEIYFIVYTRWGEEVYRTEDPDHVGWDGTFRGKPLAPDAYGWYLRVRCGNGQWFENKGNVTLLR